MRTSRWSLEGKQRTVDRFYGERRESAVLRDEILRNINPQEAVHCSIDREKPYSKDRGRRFVVYEDVYIK